MDGQTYVQSKMRHLKSQKRKNRNSHKNNKISTKKVSFINQNKNFLTELWQLLFFTSTSTFLILTYFKRTAVTICLSVLSTLSLFQTFKPELDQMLLLKKSNSPSFLFCFPGYVCLITSLELFFPIRFLFLGSQSTSLFGTHPKRSIDLNTITIFNDRIERYFFGKNTYRINIQINLGKLLQNPR